LNVLNDSYDGEHGRILRGSILGLPENPPLTTSLFLTGRRRSDPGPVQPRSWRNFRTRTRIALTREFRHHWLPSRSKGAGEPIRSNAESLMIVEQKRTDALDDTRGIVQL
jgi:hypothetical protein